MTTTSNDAETQTGAGQQGRRAVPRAKLWIFFGLFFIVAVTMYAGTMYRIQNYGYTGIGQDQLAHPEQDGKAQTNEAQSNEAQAAPKN